MLIKGPNNYLLPKKCLYGIKFCRFCKPENGTKINPHQNFLLTVLLHKLHGSRSTTEFCKSMKKFHMKGFGWKITEFFAYENFFFFFFYSIYET